MAHDFLLILLFSHIISTNVHACNQTERASLLSFASTLSSRPLNWTSVNCCHWKGITCNKDGLVTHLLLSSKGLKGDIFPSSSSLGNLTCLTHLNLSHNSLSGSLETEFFSSLDRLKILDLSFNLLSGKLPFSLPSHNIQTLDLSSNRFHGAIPSSFFQQAQNLTSFNVHNNSFSGLIPSSLCLHSSPLIRLLDFSLNAFNGSISPGLGECSKLQIFRAGNNILLGLLPKDIYNATKLKEIAFPSNSLHGAISEKIFNLTNLEILDISFNQLSGVLPLHFGKLSKLKLLALDYNHFEGSLPPSLMNCTNIVEIRMAANNLGGDISMLNFSKLSHLSKLDLLRNHFTGTFPTSLYSCQSLKAIRLTANNLKGQIQPEILSLKSLSFLSLSGLTNITGAMKILMHCKSLQTLLLSYSFKGEEMPFDEGMVGFGGFQNLRYLSFCYCDFTGQIPLWLSKLKNVEILGLVGSRITGPIPRSLGTLPKLLFLNLSDNQISGEFPKELCGLPRLLHEPTTTQVDDYIDLPIFTAADLYPIFYPRRLSNFAPTVDLSLNHIRGRIPTKIGQIHLVHNLDLSSNYFSGNIPEQISNLKNLENLSLSMNHLSGNIPLSMASLNFLKSLNVSYNNLEGSIPTSTQLQSFNASAFEGNLKLCGAPLPNECLPIKGIDADSNNNQGVDNGHQFPWLYIFTALGFIVGFWVVFGSLIVKKTWRYAYFQFLDHVQDRLYVMITVRMTMMKRRLRGD
ncbi:receptor-like protein 2 isoform X1 [Malus sylvestris]|uniref:receptor-like protein 2 isoform X1 n=1 Tax=Malus sylvestris TaxID=3752 RepID=UPI0021AC61B3|nr:receptor-like protein 2 isoform X1 [Malus sylvestris]